jgi:DNA-binding NarL/FixJ family response regulator
LHDLNSHGVDMTSRHRVLVVEDYKPFREVLCALVQRRTDVVIVGEATDGLHAIQQADALRPDVVMLDIGLPRLNGIEAAARIRTAVPNAKLMFVTNEPSLEVVQEAFNMGAHGYVYKPRAQRDVCKVLDAILGGAQFVSGGLERIALGDSLASHRHDVVFCATDAVLVEEFGRFIANGLCEESAVIALVTDAHQASLGARLQASHLDLAAAIKQRRYITMSIDELLAKVTVNGWPDRAQFLNVAEDVLTEAAWTAGGEHARVVACGECAPTLWAHGHIDAAIHLEHLWDELAKSRQVDVLCAYPLTAHDESVLSVRRLCAEHTAVEIR